MNCRSWWVATFGKRHVRASIGRIAPPNISKDFGHIVAKLSSQFTSDGTDFVGDGIVGHAKLPIFIAFIDVPRVRYTWVNRENWMLGQNVLQGEFLRQDETAPTSRL